MKRYLQYTMALLLTVFFASCEYAKFPIDNTPNVKIDARLLGNWKIKGKYEEFTMIKQNDYKYLILYKNRKREDVEKYPAFLSVIDNVSFLNVYAQDESSAGYFFIKIIDINPLKNVVTAAAVSDTTIKYITEPAELRERIAKNLNNPAFYSDTTYFYRIRKQ